ncbi:MAG: hypothetical protein ACOX0O_08430, partial [Candidatus Methanoculleus thermohydrogenotrophicum]
GSSQRANPGCAGSWGALMAATRKTPLCTHNPRDNRTGETASGSSGRQCVTDGEGGAVAAFIASLDRSVPCRLIGFT